MKRSRHRWCISFLQYDGKWHYLAPGPSTRTFGSERSGWRDIVQSKKEAEVFSRKRDAETLAMLIVTQNPNRIGKVMIVRA